MKLFTFLVAYLIAQPVNAESLETTSDVTNYTDQIMSLVETGQIEDAFEIAKEHWPLPDAEIQALVGQSLDQRATVDKRFGQGLGVEFACSESSGESLFRLMYMEKFQRHVIVWKFVFYKPEEAWLLNSIAWDDDIQQLFACDS